MKTFKDLLIELNACENAIKWAKDMTIEEVVEKCHRGDWLLWLAYKVDIGLQPLTLAKGHCAATVLHLMIDDRSKKAVEVAISFGEGKCTREELDAAAYAFYAAYASAAAFVSAAYAASDAARIKNQLLTADICRKYIGQLIIENVNKILKEDNNE